MKQFKPQYGDGESSSLHDLIAAAELILRVARSRCRRRQVRTPAISPRDEVSRSAIPRRAEDFGHRSIETTSAYLWPSLERALESESDRDTASEYSVRLSEFPPHVRLRRRTRK